MFANLMDREEKGKFLELVYKIANCDQNYADEEEELVNNYKIELGLTSIPETDSIENILKYFGDKGDQIKKIIFFELYGMIMADGLIADKEEKILMQIKENFTLDEVIYENLMNAAIDLQKAYDAVYTAVFD